jgi:serine/threonine-protein kinase
MAEEQIGKYNIIEKRGEGGFGVLYKALDPMIDRVVALKVLHPQYASDERLSAWFRREAKAMARLSHPNIVTIHNFEIAGDRHFIVMEYVDGGDLDEEIKRGGNLPISDIVSFAIQMTSAFGYAHESGVVHRDIKPSNIMIDTGGRVKITDFGIAKILGDSKLTKTGSGVGSLHYMSPEQIEGKPVDTRSDIYSLGITFYQMITGKVPFTDDSDFVVMRAHLDQPPIDPLELRSDVPVELSRIVLRMLEKRPEDRYASMAEVASDLRKLSAAEPVEREPHLDQHAKTKTSITPVDRMPVSTDVLRPQRRTGRSLYWIAAVILLTAIAIGGYLLFGGGDERTAEKGDLTAESASKPQDDSSAGSPQLLVVDSVSLVSEGAGATSASKIDSAERKPEPTDTKTVAAIPQAEPKEGLGRLVVEVSPYDYRNPPQVVVDGKRHEMKDTPFEIDGIRPGRRLISVHFKGESFYDEVMFAEGVERRSYKFNGPTGTVEIGAEFLGTDRPNFANIIVDERKIDAGTPTQIQLVEGPHKITVAKPGFEAVDRPRIVHVKAGDRISLQFRLRPKR